MVECKKCSLCCYNVSVEVDEPEDADDIDQYVWLLLHEGLSIYVEDDQWYVEFKCRCSALNDDGTCSIYEHRPELCKRYDPKECLKHGEQDYYELIFKHPNELIKYWNNKKQ